MRVSIYQKSLEVYNKTLENERLKNTNRQYICQTYKQKTSEVFFHLLGKSESRKLKLTNNIIYRIYGNEFRRSSPRLLRTTDCHKCAC